MNLQDETRTTHSNIIIFPLPDCNGTKTFVLQQYDFKILWLYCPAICSIRFYVFDDAQYLSEITFILANWNIFFCSMITTIKKIQFNYQKVTGWYTYESDF